MAKAPKLQQEKNLLDTLNRIAKNPTGYSVLYVSVSKLKPKNRPPEFVKVMAKLFDGIVGTTFGSMFILTNSDFVIFGKNIKESLINSAIEKLRMGLSSDPMLDSQDIDTFAHLYNFPTDFMQFFELIENIITKNTNMSLTTPVAKKAITADKIDSIIEHLNNIDISELVKHQSVLRFKGAGNFKVLFQEFFVAIKDLSKQFDDTLNLTANKWLFLYLTQTLDKKTMASFSNSEIKNWPENVSINLNLSSVFSKEFIHFAKNFFSGKNKIIVEIQLMDAFNNLPFYFEVKEILKKGGHKLLIDNMSPNSLKMLNIKKFEPDIIKIFWEPLLEFDTNNKDLKDAIKLIGRENVILAKVDSEKAIRWGVSYGITAFQGKFIDNLEVAITRSKCPDSHNCTSDSCLKRKRLISGDTRNECTQIDNLEFLLGSNE